MQEKQLINILSIIECPFKPATANNQVYRCIVVKLMLLESCKQNSSKMFTININIYRKIRDIYGQQNRASHGTIKRLVERFQRNGSVEYRGAKKYSRSEENIRASIVEKLKMSIICYHHLLFEYISLPLLLILQIMQILYFY